MNGSQTEHVFGGRQMNIKFIAIPALALAAGISLAACGSQPTVQGAAPAGSSIKTQCAALKKLSLSNNGNSNAPLTQADIAKANALANSETPPLRGAMRSLINDAVTMQKHQDAGNTQGLLDDYGKIMIDAGMLKGICPGIDITSSSAKSSATPSPVKSKAPVAAAPVATPAPTKTVYVAPAKPAPPPASSYTSSTAVVRQFYQDINNQNYSGAWALGGSVIGGGSYSGWVAGYATTVSVRVGTFSAYGSNQVQTSLYAVQTDGSTKSYEGTYTVSGGVIVAANIVQTGATGPGTGGGMAGGPGDY